MTSSPEKSSNKHQTSLEPINNLIELLLAINSPAKEKSELVKDGDLRESLANKLSSDRDEQNLDYEAVENFTSDEIEYETSAQQTIEARGELTEEQSAVSPSEKTLFTEPKSWQTREIKSSRSPRNKLPKTSLNLEVAPEENPNSTKAASQELVLVDSVNSLIPLIVELLKYKIDESQDSILKQVRPELERIIKEQSLEDSPKMAAAVAKILPNAISEGMNLSPEAIAKAIAPELALCITEQIRLDENAISEALGSEMGKAIKTQIELEKDAMVDALYPVIGNTIAKYMVEVVQEINAKVERTLSPEGIKRKIQARIQGVTEAELIFRESIGYYVQAVFLIEKDSGILIQEIQRTEDEHLDSGMIAGMLTAIRSFANDCIASGSELDGIDYGDFQIPIEVAGYCYLAVVVKGEPTKEFRNKIRSVLGDVVLHYGYSLSKYQGDMSTVPPQVKLKLGELIEDKNEVQKSSPILLWLVIFILGATLIPWGFFTYRRNVAKNIESAVAAELDAAPELSIYRLQPYVHRGTITLSGKVPSKYLQQQAEAITQEIAATHNLQLDNQIVAIKVPPNPNLISGEVKRLTESFNQQSNTSINTEYDFKTKTLRIDGFVPNLAQQESITQIFDRIPGIDKIILNLKTQLPKISEKIYFDLGSSRFDFDDASSKIDSVSQFLSLYPQLNLKLTAHSDGQGSIELNQTLSKERCQNVVAALKDKGVDSSRLTTQCEEPIMSRNSNQEAWLLRYVSFEPYIAANNPNNNK